MRRRRLLLVAGLLSAVTVVLTYPQPFTLATATGGDSDSLFSIWRLAWIAHALTNRLPLFDANIFFPERLTFAYSDAVLLPGLIDTPLIGAGVKPAVVYNLSVLATFPAAGIAMYTLVRELTESSSAATLSAFVFAFSPYRFAHFAHLELLWMWPIPLAFLALHRLTTRPNYRAAALLGVSVVAQVLGCLYYAVFLCFGLVIVGAAQAIGRPKAALVRLAGLVTAVAALSALLLWPYMAVYRAAARLHGPRTLADVANWSAHWTSYLAVADRNLLYGRPGVIPGIETTLFPGAVAVILALYGLRPFSRNTLGYCLMAFVAIDVSLGVNGSGVFVPAFAASGTLRVPARAFVLVSTSIAVLAGLGIAKLGDQFAARHAPSRTHWLAAAAIVVAMVEVTSVPLPLRAVDADPPALYRWLAQQPDAVVLEWPLPKASDIGVTHEPEYLYYSTLHWKRMVNGYSGHNPESFIRLLDAMEDFPSEQSIRSLHGRSVTHVVLHQEYAPERFERMVQALSNRREFEPLLRERRPRGDVAVFRLLP
jgi:hypothetical protein